MKNICQVNQITHWLDNSNVYGSTDDVARNLRTLSGGILRTEPCRNGRECLPFTGMDNCRGPTKRCGLAGIVCLVYGGKWNNLVFYTILPQSHIFFLMILLVITRFDYKNHSPLTALLRSKPHMPTSNCKRCSWLTIIETGWIEAHNKKQAKTVFEIGHIGSIGK